MTMDKKYLYTGSYPIRWDDVDLYGHVTHTNYFLYMLEVRWKWFYSLNLKENIQPLTPIISTSMVYKKPLFYPGEVTIKVYGFPPKETTFSFYHEIFQANNPDVLCAEGLAELIWLDEKTKRPTAIPEEFRRCIYP